MDRVECSERGIAVVDPDNHFGDRISRMVRWLGHLPVVVHDAQALRTRGTRLGEFELLLMICPLTDSDAGMAVVQETRSLVGREVPLGLMVPSGELLRMFMVMHARHGDDAITLPLSMAGLYRFIRGLLPQRDTGGE